MTDQWPLMFSATMIVFSLMGVGAFLRYVGLLTSEADRSITLLIVRLLLPCLVFSKIVDNELLHDPINVWLPPLIGYTSIVWGLLGGLALAWLPGRVIGLHTGAQRRTFIFCVGIYNFGYLAIPLIEKLFDEKTLGILFVHNMGVTLAFWTCGILTLQGRFNRDWWKALINGPSIMVVLALVLNATGLGTRLPQFSLDTIAMLGRATIPIALLLVGATAIDELLKLGRSGTFRPGWKMLLGAWLLRLGLLPLGFLLICSWLPLSVDLKRVIAVEAAMPSAVMPILLAHHYGGDRGVAVRIVVSTSILALLTIPFWIQAGLYILGVPLTP